MSVSQSPWQAAPPAQLQWADGAPPRSLRFNDVYYSATSGLEESRYVFQQGNQLFDAWKQRARFTITETGFGTGLNFLATWQAWREDPDHCGKLHYIALEKYPLRLQELRRALSAWPELKEFAHALLESYPVPLPGRHRLNFEQDQIQLDLIFADATQALKEMEAEPGTGVNCWYLDGFAPSRNPAMWQPDLFARALAG